jgi:hypothetical protein
MYSCNFYTFDLFETHLWGISLGYADMSPLSHTWGQGISIQNVTLLMSPFTVGTDFTF